MASSKVFVILVGFLSLAFAEGESWSESFNEELLLQPLPNGDLLASFNFVTLSPLSKSRQHFDLMPRYEFDHNFLWTLNFRRFSRLVGELLDDHKLQELDVALTRGVWRTQHWGLPHRTSAAGAKASAFFSDGKKY